MQTTYPGLSQEVISNIAQIYNAGAISLQSGDINLDLTKLEGIIPDLESGRYLVCLTAYSQNDDLSETTFEINITDIMPSVYLDLIEKQSGSTYTISGFAFGATEISLNNVAVPVNADGSFEVTANIQSETMTFTLVDEYGNSTQNIIQAKLPADKVVEYEAKGDITGIEPDTVTFAEDRFTIPAGITEFTFRDNGQWKKATYDGDADTWTIEAAFTVTVAEAVYEAVYGIAEVVANPTIAAEGTIVTVTISDIESGKQFSSITVTGDDTGAEVPTTEVTAGEEYSFVMPAEAITVTVTLEDGSLLMYIVSYDGNGNTGGSVPIHETTYKTGDTVTVMGNTGNLVKRGYTFTGWNTAADGSGTDYNPGDTFIMGSSDVTLYAKWVPVDSDSNGDTDKTTPKPTPKKPETQPTQITTTPSEDGKISTVSATISADIDENTGIVSATMAASVIEDLVAKAKDFEEAGQKSVIEVKVEATADTKTVEAEIPGDFFKQVSGMNKAEIKLDAGIADVTFDEEAVDTISDAVSEGNISMSITKVDKSSLTEEVRAKVGDRPVYNFTVKAGNSVISNFNGGYASVSIPYTPEPDEKKNCIVVYYIDDAGKLKTVRGRYDDATGTVNFKTSHFSLFAVGYNEVTFSDVAESAWYSEAVGFMAARGIVRGVGGGKFAPEDKVTRADFLIMVMNSYGIEPDSDIADNFSDAGDKYYTKYLGTAKRLGLVSGVGNNLYLPEATISRQDMFVILYRMLKKLGELPESTGSKTLEDFNDADDIAGYAIEALKLFVEAGTIQGDGTKLTPKATSTRAQAVQVLYNLLSL